MKGPSALGAFVAYATGMGMVVGPAVDEGGRWPPSVGWSYRVDAPEVLMASPSPQVVVFDVNETLSDMSAIRDRFEEVGAPGHLMPTWFAGVLRDGFALTAAGGYAEFGQVADAVLRELLAGSPEWKGDLGTAVSYVLDGFAELGLHPDVPEG